MTGVSATTSSSIAATTDSTTKSSTATADTAASEMSTLSLIEEKQASNHEKVMQELEKSYNALDYNPYDDDDDDADNNGKRSALKKPGNARQGSSMYRKVHFREVHIREYGMVLGDNPAVSHGAPVQLEWEFQEEHDPVHIDNYEKARQHWRAKDRRGFLLNAHKRVKILFAAGYTIDEIAKATMDMKELRQLRADSLKSQGMVTTAIMTLLSGSAELTGRTVRSVTVLPNAMIDTSMVLSKAMGTEMSKLTNRVVNSTANAAKRSTQMVADASKNTTKLMQNSTAAMYKGTTGVVKGTGKLVTETGKVGMDVMKGTSKVGMDVVKGTGKVGMDVMKGTSKVGIDVVKGTGKVGMDVVKGTGKVGNQVVKGTGQFGNHVVRGTSKVGTSVVKGTGNVVKGTGKVGMDVVKGTGNVVKTTGVMTTGMVRQTSDLIHQSSKAVMKGTGVLFTGTAGRASKAGLGVMKGTSKRISKIVLNSSMHNNSSASKHSRRRGSDSGTSEQDNSNSSSNDYMNEGGMDNSAPSATTRQSLHTDQSQRSNIPKIPKPHMVARHRSFDAELHKKEQRIDEQLELCEELREMEGFLEQLEGMDRQKVHEIIKEEQELAEELIEATPPAMLPGRLSLAPNRAKEKDDKKHKDEMNATVH